MASKIQYQAIIIVCFYCVVLSTCLKFNYVSYCGKIKIILLVCAQRKAQM